MLISGRDLKQFSEILKAPSLRGPQPPYKCVPVFMYYI